MWRHTRLVATAATAVMIVLGTHRPASADGTLFAGAYLNPTRETLRGVAVGVTVLVAGLEFEYARVAEDTEAGTPGLQTGSLSVVVQTPTGRVTVYGVFGAGLFRQQLGATTSDSGTSLHAGGGLKIGLAGPVGLRLDYRVIAFGGEGEDRKRQRVYAGVRVDF